MKLTKSKLRQIIKEEFQKLREQSQGDILVSDPLQNWVRTQQDLEIDIEGKDSPAPTFVVRGADNTQYFVTFDDETGKIVEFDIDGDKIAAKNTKQVIRYIKKHAGL